MENKDTGGALAGGLIAPALMDTLVAKGILTADDARSVLIKLGGQSVATPPMLSSGRPPLSWSPCGSAA
jgi:hypothetical protein